MAFSSDEVRIGASAAALMVVYYVHETIRNRGIEPKEAAVSQQAAKAREVERAADGKTANFLAGPDFTTGFLALTTNERKSNHAPTRPQRRGQGRGIGQPAAKVCAFGG